MPSFEAINYSLRPSKSIQRHIVFEGVRRLQSVMDLDRLVYVGFGSIWFTDFVMAHKTLNVDDMVSIESDEIGYKRAKFNSPYATVRVLHGVSSAVLPSLYKDSIITSRPWMVWLDYDFEYNETLNDDIRSVIENAPANSILLVTFNGLDSKYGQALDRPLRLRNLFGGVVPDDLPKSACKGEGMQQILADYALDFMTSVAAEITRPGGFVPAFKLIYRDGAPMVTVGGIMPSKGAARIVSDEVNSSSWQCRPTAPIVAPHLTIREATALQALLPREGGLSSSLVEGLGFALDEKQISAFEKYYRQYPAFAQIVA